MKVKLLFSMFLAVATLPIFCQEKGGNFELTASKNEVLQGKPITVTYQFEGGNVHNFTPPNWKNSDFLLKSGPNQSSNITMMNGVVRSSISYTYIIVPKKSGELTVPSASIETENGQITSNELIIKVLENPDYAPPSENELQEDFEEQPFFKKDKKEQKKRTTVRI